MGEDEELPLEDGQGLGIAVDGGDAQVLELFLAAEEAQIEEDADVVGAELEAGQLVDELVDEAQGLVLAALGRAVALRGDEAAPAGGGFDETAPDELFVGLLDGAAGRAELFGQIALGGQLLSRFQAARLDLFLEERYDLLVGRLGAREFFKLDLVHDRSLWSVP